MLKIETGTVIFFVYTIHSYVKRKFVLISADLFNFKSVE